MGPIGLHQRQFQPVTVPMKKEMTDAALPGNMAKNV